MREQINYSLYQTLLPHSRVHSNTRVAALLVEFKMPTEDLDCTFYVA